MTNMWRVEYRRADRLPGDEGSLIDVSYHYSEDEARRVAEKFETVSPDCAWVIGPGGAGFGPPPDQQIDPAYLKATEYVDPAKLAAGGYKADEGKPRFGLLPPDALREVASVYTLGAKKYSDRNWERGMDWSRMYDAAMRHMWAFWHGEKNDPIDGQHHLAAAAFNVLGLLAYDIRGIGNDDRNKLAGNLGTDGQRAADLSVRAG